jgi:hypothetical protein
MDGWMDGNKCLPLHSAPSLVPHSRDKRSMRPIWSPGWLMAKCWVEFLFLSRSRGEGGDRLHQGVYAI